MRDIRDELKARRAAVMGCYADAMHHFQVENERLLRERREAVEKFENEKATLDAMIVMEERRLAGIGDQHTVVAEPTVSLRDFIMAMIERAGPIGSDDLRAAVAEAGYSQSGRAFNMTLQNIAAGGRVEKREDGRFVRAPAPLFGMPKPNGEAPMTAQ